MPGASNWARITKAVSLLRGAGDYRQMASIMDCAANAGQTGAVPFQFN